MPEHNLEERMQMWRDGLLSDEEILSDLLIAQSEVINDMFKDKVLVKMEHDQ